MHLMQLLKVIPKIKIYTVNSSVSFFTKTRTALGIKIKKSL